MCYVGFDVCDVCVVVLKGEIYCVFCVFEFYVYFVCFGDEV